MIPRQTSPIIAGLILSLLSLSCSNDAPLPPAPRTYEVTFTVVMVPDSDLEENFGMIIISEDLGRYLVGVLDRYPSYVSTGSWAPLVRTGQESRMQLTPSPEQEARTLEEYGFKLNRFAAQISIREDDPFSGVITGTRNYSYGVTLREPVGNSTGHGGSISGGYRIRAGQPWPERLYSLEGTSLWGIIHLSGR